MAAGRSPGYVRVDKRKASGLSQADLAKAIGINLVEFLDHAETIGFAPMEPAGADSTKFPTENTRNAAASDRRSMGRGPVAVTLE
ncbi:hypothetical protein Amn_12230 [Aminobacter sp. Y103A]|uniref:Msr6184 protein n=1 Tax=Mesorhizobium japonicum (strain LMG 29417 / CECT 9101 / MAFF 303099) TaxID=266835 RepID=Q98A27_RHILO|nr:msr6184 [Mesorhizobium japonicum MAFF 303099]BBD36343.1 hypothetical protein Amn_12230 [Aminobacter sp. SS-2016]